MHPGNERRSLAIESVWDYPRPAQLEPCGHRLRVRFAGAIIADSVAGYRVLETSHPPTYYLPPDDIRAGLLTVTGRRSWCEWKGAARYWTARLAGREAVDCAWSYPEPTATFTLIRDYVAFYAGAMDACFVDDEQVMVQEGDFYGGWITANLHGPFKGAPGTAGW